MREPLCKCQGSVPSDIRVLNRAEKCVFGELRSREQDLLRFADVISSYLYVSIYKISYYSFKLVLKLFILGTSTFFKRDKCGGALKRLLHFTDFGGFS